MKYLKENKKNSFPLKIWVLETPSRPTRHYVPTYMYFCIYWIPEYVRWRCGINFDYRLDSIKLFRQGGKGSIDDKWWWIWSVCKMWKSINPWICKKKHNKKYTCTYLTDICTCNGVFFRGQQSIIAYGCQNFVVVFDPKSVQVRCHIKKLRS